MARHASPSTGYSLTKCSIVAGDLFVSTAEHASAVDGSALAGSRHKLKPASTELASKANLNGVFISMTSWLQEHWRGYLCANLESDLLMEAKILSLQAMVLLSKSQGVSRAKRQVCQAGLSHRPPFTKVAASGRRSGVGGFEGQAFDLCLSVLVLRHQSLGRGEPHPALAACHAGRPVSPPSNLVTVRSSATTARAQA